MKFRHEVKHSVSYADRLVLEGKLSAVMKPDCHVRKDGTTFIRSLYFDTPYDACLNEKRDGVNRRDKYRIRYYDNDPSYMKLEKKSKQGELTSKVFCLISEDEVRRILAGDILWMLTDSRPLISELYMQMRTRLLKPKSIVDYTRRPFVCDAGNVRVTLDYDIRTCAEPMEFLNPAAVTIPGTFGTTVLEVKWDEYLPHIIRDAVNLKGVLRGPFSKYELSRMNG